MRFLRARSIPVLSTQRTAVAVSQGASESNTGVRAHIVRDQNHTAELFDTSPHLIKRKEGIVRIAFNHSRSKVVVCCLRGIGRRHESTKSLDEMLIGNIETRIRLSSTKTIDIVLSHIAL